MQSHTVICPQGHHLRASQRVVGKTLPCPVCKEMVIVDASSAVPPSHLASPSRVNSPVGRDSTKQESISRLAPAPGEKRDTLSDTGVMRILGDFVAPRVEPVVEDERKFRSCPVCGCDVVESASVCKTCQCYIGPSPDFFKNFAK